ncbi:MAG: septal ring lytic transglycosylase RlpA family protein [Alphaproteobacteria bacterium]|nr:septal ring lytic transglycosylase RlpA family protein [Alphaproteobacteria bacterium]
MFSLAILAGCATRTPPPLPSAPPPQPPPPPPPIIAAPAPTAVLPFFSQTGVASFYGAAHHGKTTADGGTFDRMALTAAHPTLAFGTVVRVTNLSNGRTVKVEINDRGPRAKGRIIDLSLAAARMLGMEKSGIARVRLEAFRADQPTEN